MPCTQTAGRSRLVRIALAACSVAALVADAHADIDLTGRWLQGPDRYAEIVQSGDDVSVTFSYYLGGGAAEPVTFHMTGTFDQTVLTATGSGGGITMYPYGEGMILAGTFSFFTGYPNNSGLRFDRCECFDGNSADGDGCGSDFRVEPCFTCTAEPSVCTPVADGGACDDRRDCTSGETCSAGVCDGGAPVSPCIDMTGGWRVETGSYGLDDDPSSYDTTFVQRDGALFSGSRIGSIDTATGEFQLVSWGGNGFCTQSSSLTGTATPDGLEFDGQSVVNTSTIRFCMGFGADAHARRCDAEGCDLTDCTGKADGTPCSDQDPCTKSDVCTDGACAGIEKCAACEFCDVDGTCDPGPRPQCSRTLDQDSSRFQFVSKPATDKFSLLWSWSQGEELDADRLAPAESDFTLCVFQQATSALVYRTTLASDATCAKGVCWKGNDGSWSYRNDADATGITSMSLRSGIAGRSRIQLRGKGSQLFQDWSPPDLPLTMPIVTQLQSSSGGCFEATFDTEGIKRNDEEKFSAVGGSAP